jgi:phosphoribosylformylglycinamidine synthase
MTEGIYEKPITSFDSGAIALPVRSIPIMSEGRAALEQINKERGLGFDDFDLDYYTDLFKVRVFSNDISLFHTSCANFWTQEKLGRDPTDVECFDMGQSNSEHSRHWFFGGKMVIDGKEKPFTLFAMVKATLTDENTCNSIIAFHDNSSCIRGYPCDALRPSSVDMSAPVVVGKQVLHPILTAETHNFPSGVAPFAGAETGTGGRLRDVMATGRGAYPVAGICAYCVGNLNIPGYVMPWEDQSFRVPFEPRVAPGNRNQS